MVESGSLENYYGSNPIEGSNPSLSSQIAGRVLKLADRRVSEARVRKDVWVQVPPRPHIWKLLPMAETKTLPTGTKCAFVTELKKLRVNVGEKVARQTLCA